MTESAPQDTFQASSPESADNAEAPVSLLKLQERRRIEAIKMADEKLLSLVRILDYKNNPNSSIARVPDNEWVFDVGELSLDDVLAYDAIGLRPSELLAVVGQGADPDQDDKFLFQTQVGTGTLVTKRYRRGVTLTLKTDKQELDANNGKPSVALNSAIAERYSRSPAHSALKRLADTIVPENGIPESIETDEFRPDEDRLGTLCILSQLGFIPTGNMSMVLGGDRVEQVLASHLKPNVEVAVENSETLYFLTIEGNKSFVSFNKSTGAMKLGFIRANPDDYYMEHANQHAEKSIPFIETECARQMLSALSEVGLEFSSKMQAEIVRPGEAERFGSVYTQLTREVAKWINRPSRRRLLELFQKTDIVTGDEVDLEEVLAKALDKLDVEKIKGESAKVFFTMVKDCISRQDADIVGIKELPHTESDIQISGGACFDVATYYLSAAGTKNGIHSIEAGGVKLFEKTHGHHTFMLQEPALLNGVRLPKGALMQKGEDGGWAVLRLTPLTFDSDIDRLATGSEMAKALKQNSEAVSRLGGAALRHLILAVA